MNAEMVRYVRRKTGRDVYLATGTGSAVVPETVLVLQQRFVSFDYYGCGMTGGMTEVWRDVPVVNEPEKSE